MSSVILPSRGVRGASGVRAPVIRIGCEILKSLVSGRTGSLFFTPLARGMRILLFLSPLVVAERCIDDRGVLTRTGFSGARLSPFLLVNLSAQLRQEDEFISPFPVGERSKQPT